MGISDAPWQTYDWEGRRIAWRRAGQGPPVVFCHGTPFSSYVWEGQADALVARHTVFVWDMPGYGRSSKAPEHAVDLGVQGRALSGLLHHWGLDRPAVVAHDFGGAVALRAHLLHACDMASLTLVDVVALRPWGSEFFRLVREHAEVFAALPEQMHRGLLTAYIEGAAHHPIDGPALRRLIEPWLTGEGQAAFYAQIAQADERWTLELEQRIHEVRCPTTVVWGAEDTLIPVEQAHRLADALGTQPPTVIQGAGHLVQLDAPRKLEKVLGTSLRGSTT